MPHTSHFYVYELNRTMQHTSNIENDVAYFSFERFSINKRIEEITVLSWLCWKDIIRASSYRTSFSKFGVADCGNQEHKTCLQRFLQNEIHEFKNKQKSIFII